MEQTSRPDIYLTNYISGKIIIFEFIPKYFCKMYLLRAKEYNDVINMKEHNDAVLTLQEASLDCSVQRGESCAIVKWMETLQVEDCDRTC